MTAPAVHLSGRSRPQIRCGRWALALAVLVASAAAGPLAAQPAPSAPPSLSQRLLGQHRVDKNAKMLMKADQLVYDDDHSTVTAQGSVEIYYSGNTLLADRVVYDRKTGRVHAYGHVRVTDPQGNVARSTEANLTQNFSDGFVRALQIDTTERTRLAAGTATRTGGRVTVFEKGVYTACEACAKHPEKPPEWDIRAARVIHDEQEKTIYFEDASFELFGHPIAWLPYFSAPDPTVKRKTGFLAPRYLTSSELGFGAAVPFFWAIRPDMDLTVQPTWLSRQGFLMQGRFRHQLANGNYTVNAAGIFQQDRSAFPTVDNHGVTIGGGGHTARGALSTTGKFDITDKWSVGWDINLLSDKWVLDDYKLWGANWSEAVSTLYLNGQGDRNWFNLQGYYFYGMASDDTQKQLPVAAPVLDYHNIVATPVLGGEASFRINSTTTIRDSTDFEPTTRANARLVDGTKPVTKSDKHAQNFTCGVFIADCFVAGAAGVYSRVSAEAQWRRTVIDPIGESWTPFVFAQASAMWMDIPHNAALNNFLDPGNRMLGLGMAGAGLEYRYPLVIHSAVGTHIIEPIAQLIVRPDEPGIKNHPDEGSQSLFFDDTNLFDWNKFAGWDRVEGGTRLNAGLQYSWSLPTGQFLSALFGQSYQLAGRNSYAVADIANTGLDSGLQRAVSDYVGGVSFQATQNLSLATHFRFDQQTWDPQAFEAEARYDFGRVSGSLIYGRFAAQPDIGYFDTREGIVGTSMLQTSKNTYVSGAARYDLDLGRFDAAQVGVGYIDDCIALGLVYGADWSNNGNKGVVHTVLFSLSLRTLGGVGPSIDALNGLSQANISRALP
jgi:LPS-assembly protein